MPVHVCVTCSDGGGVCHGMLLWRPDDASWDWVLSFYQVGPRILTQLSGLVARAYCLINNHAGPKFGF